MRRSDKVTSYRCPSPCPEVGRFSYGHRDEGMDLERRYGGGKWRCVRHTDPEAVLSPSNLTREVTFTLGPSPNGPGLYWLPSHGGLVSGFTHGPGWKAFREDFPEGTVLRVRVEAVLPGDAGRPS